MKFEEFQKIPRLSREVVITEKIDGTNAQILIIESEGLPVPEALCQEEGLIILAGSRKRWLSLETDNYGFARWVMEHKKEIAGLGPGRHYGEWWGKGIQRGYGLEEKRFSLFNVAKWGNDLVRPACCSVVPILYQGMFDIPGMVEGVMNMLRMEGSYAAPGFMRPEGIIIYHTAGNLYFKKTLENDDKPKGSKEVS